MKQFVIIGLGNFGYYLATRLYEMGHEILAIDKDPNRVQEIKDSVTQAVIADGTDRRVITDAPGQNEPADPDWSPDGRALAYTVYYDGFEQSRINTIRADGTGKRTVFPRNASQPAFSPDGTKIAFYYTMGMDIWTINAADGTGLTNVTNAPDTAEAEPSWGPKPRTGG